MSKKTRLMSNWAIINKMIFGTYKSPKNINESVLNKINSYKSQMLYNIEELNKLVGYNPNINIKDITGFKNYLNESFKNCMKFSQNIMKNDENVKSMIKDDINLVLESTNYDKEFITNQILQEHFLKTSIDYLLIKPVLNHIKECNCAKHLKSEISLILETHTNYRNNLINTILYSKEK